MSSNEQKIKNDLVDLLFEQWETQDELSMEDIYKVLHVIEEIDGDFTDELVKKTA